MFNKKDITYRFETTNEDEVRDYMEYAHLNGYKFNYETKYAAGMQYYDVTISFSRYQAEFLAIMALTDNARKFHTMRNKERDSIIEDAERDGYAKAVEDQVALKRAKE